MSNIFKSSQIKIIDSVVKQNDEIDIRELEISRRIEESKKTASIIIEKAKNEAENIIIKSSRDAEKVLENAHSQVKNIFDTAKENGYNNGFDEGYEEGKKTSDVLIEEANEIKKNYLIERETILSNIEKDVIYLVMSLCEKILNQKLDNDKETIISIILKGINSLNTKEKLLIKVSKEDYDIVDMSKQRILAMANLVEDIEVRIDSTLSRGGCIIEGLKGNVDTSLELQIQEMKKLLTSLLNSE